MRVGAPDKCLVPLGVQRGHRFPGTRVTDGCEPPCGCWELNPDPLEEHLS